MQAIFTTGNQQFTVTEGDELLVDLLEAQIGDEVRFDKVLLLTGENGVKVGAPTVPGAVVVGKILKQIKGVKTRAVFFRRRKDSKTARGGRQKYHNIKITAIEGA
jgi:large subunit ribosomal protein L21